jgi:hypothetical protein
MIYALRLTFLIALLIGFACDLFATTSAVHMFVSLTALTIWSVAVMRSLKPSELD